MVTEDTLRFWASPPSETEAEKADNAVRVIRDCLNDSAHLNGLRFTVFPQGSYRARTNTRLNSDVDICIRSDDSLFYDLGSTLLTPSEVGISVPAPISFADFRNRVGGALTARFGTGVSRGNKAFDVHANSYRLDADVVVAFEHRRYYLVGGRPSYHSGIKFFADDGTGIENWPEQTYDNGVGKNGRTQRRYKAAIRILKRLRDKMALDGVSAAQNIGSFQIESLVWNVPDGHFVDEAHRGMMCAVLANLCVNLRDESLCAEWREVNELKYLLKGRPAVRIQFSNFVDAAWDYVDFN